MKKEFLEHPKTGSCSRKNGKKFQKSPEKDRTASKRVFKTYHTQKHQTQATNKHHINKSSSN
jgi:hypothetical protein